MLRFRCDRCTTLRTVLYGGHGGLAWRTRLCRHRRCPSAHAAPAFRRRRTRAGRDTAQACGGRQGLADIVLQRVDMQLHNLGPSWVVIARTPYTNGWPDSVIRVPIPGMVSLTGVPSGPSPKPRVHLAPTTLTAEICPATLSGRTKSS